MSEFTVKMKVAFEIQIVHIDGEGVTNKYSAKSRS